MEWRRKPGSDPADPHGVADLLSRACETVLATPVGGTRFLYSTDEMLRVSRGIEQAAMVDPSVPLYVGVQQGHRLNAQEDVYDTLVCAGVQVHAFGVDHGTGVRGVRWTRVDADPHALAAQWFLVRMGRHPRALVGFELSSSPGGPRRWEGFETRDPRLVEGIASHLAELVEQGDPLSETTPAGRGGVREHG
jgi:hypothetical protein